MNSRCSNYTTLILFHSIYQMLGIFLEFILEDCMYMSKFRKRKRKLLSCVYALHKTL